MISFARGVPAPDCLPVEELADCARAAVERDGPTVLNYGPVAGYQPLREWVAERHAVETSQVLVTNGSLQGLSLLAGLLLDPGSRILVEGPTYDRTLHIAARHTAEPVPLPMDDDGLDPDAIELPAAFLYTIPTFQNPSGRTLSLERRRAIAELAGDGKLLVVEDDPYSLVRYEGERLPSIYELAEGQGVVYSFSFSKIAAPGLRVGYLIGPAELIGRLEGLAVQTYLTPALLPQATVHEFVSRGGSSRTSSASSACSRSDATRCWVRSSRNFPTARPGAALRAATSRGWTSRTARTRGRSSTRRPSGRHLREGQRLLSAPGRGVVSSACLQLRLARRDPGRASALLAARLPS